MTELEARIQAFGAVVDGAQDAMALLSLLELGVFQRLVAGPLTAHVLGEQVGVDGDRLRAFLDRVSALGFLRKDGERYRLLAADVALFDPAHGRSRALGFSTVAQLFGRCAQAVEVLTSDTSLSVAGTGAEASVEDRTRFLHYLHSRSQDIAAELAGALLAAGPAARVVDLGSGLGSYAAAVLDRAPEARALLVDRPTARPAVEAFLVEAGLEDRVSFQGGDFLADDWGSGHDLAFASNLVHNLGEAATRELLALCHQRLAPGGRVVLKDLVVAEDRLSPPSATRFALSMALFTDRGGVWPAGECRAWLEDLGFVDVHEVPLVTAPDAWVLVGRRPG